MRNAESISQELDEYVVTKQLTEYFRKFFDAYLAAAEKPRDSTITARMGVWVSGFFGSGKSHYIKILSYLLENIEATNPKTGTQKRPLSFFDEHKIKDSMLLADIHRAIKGMADVMLFNIDAKADAKTERDAIVQVFLLLFNRKARVLRRCAAYRRNGALPEYQSRIRTLQNCILGSKWQLLATGT